MFGCFPRLLGGALYGVLTLFFTALAVLLIAWDSGSTTTGSTSTR